jgi:hypothetical protein
MPSITARLSTVANQDGAAVLDVSRNRITTLNSTGGFVWERLKQGQGVEFVIRDLAIESDMDLLTVERDVHEFLNQLELKHLLHK